MWTGSKFRFHPTQHLPSTRRECRARLGIGLCLFANRSEACIPHHYPAIQPCCRKLLVAAAAQAHNRLVMRSRGRFRGITNALQSHMPQLKPIHHTHRDHHFHVSYTGRCFLTACPKLGAGA